MTKLSLPPLNAVRAFEAAARRGSFVEAAVDLNVTHWAIGKQIRLLEDWLGVPLFERKSSGVALTDEGAELSNDVSAVLYRLSEATGKLRRPEVTRRVSGLVRVNVQPSFALRWLFPRLARFQELFPNIEVRVSTTSRKLQVHRVGVRHRDSVGTGNERGASLRDIDARSAAARMQSGSPAQATGANRQRSPPPRDAAFGDDPIGVVAVARGRRRGRPQGGATTGASSMSIFSFRRPWKDSAWRWRRCR